MNLLLDKDPHITGINVGTHSFKITQFADDTTLFLDGNRCSFQAALNVLETFGTFSGLKINSEKTKVIWIGCKKHCKDKLKVQAKLTWGEKRFTLLGLEFSTNLDKMLELNYKNAIQKTKKILSTWKPQNLTPIGRITIVKTFAIPKFNHLFASLPAPKNIMEELNKMLFDYFWAGKPDKVKRSIISQNYECGGLKMLDVLKFEKAMKLNWIKHIVEQQNSAWFKLLSTRIKTLNYLVILGDDWVKQLMKTANPFLNVVFENWIIFCKRQKVSCNQDILHTSLWFNSQISKTQMFFSDWFQKGISTIGDIVNSEGIVFEIGSLSKIFNFKPNTLNYYTVKSLVTKFIKRNKNGNNFFNTRPYISFHVTILFEPKCKSKSFYQSMINAEKNQPKHESK